MDIMDIHMGYKLDIMYILNPTIMGYTSSIYGMSSWMAFLTEGIDTSMKHFTVGRAEKTVSVRGAELEPLGARSSPFSRAGKPWKNQPKGVWGWVKTCQNLWIDLWIYHDWLESTSSYTSYNLRWLGFWLAAILSHPTNMTYPALKISHWIR